jgi:phosphoribosylamine---glycine ligase
MKVLVIGGGGREHALAWRIAASRYVQEVLVAPGNAGTAREAKVHNVAIAAEDIEALLAFAQSEPIDLTVVGPEAPLALGVVDKFSECGLKIFGPTRLAAQLESSKAFSKAFMLRHRIPTAAYAEFTEPESALAYIEAQGAPIVVKADGLAAGKGVVVASSVEEARAAVRMMLGDGSLGAAGARVVIEAFLAGEEASFICMVDGEHVLPLASSQDHKARDDGDCGPNTGGMGAYSPAPVVTETVHKRILDDVIYPTVRGMAAEGHPYRGFLYAGVMIDRAGAPRLLEFNCRLGDPEAQVLLMRLKSDLPLLCLAALEGRLSTETAEWDARTALGVVMAAGGYPGAYGKGAVITGLDAGDSEIVKVFQAGTALTNNQVVTAGGRVLCVTALGKNADKAQTLAYQRVRQIDFEGAFCRSDIGYRAIGRAR